MGEQLSVFISGLRRNKKYIFLSVLLFILFSLMIFPYEDLSDLVTEQIAKQTQNQVFVSFDDLSITFFPPGISLNKVNVDTAFAPPLKMNTLDIAPSIASLLAFKPGVTAQAEGLFGGSLYFSLKSGDKINDELHMQKINLELEDVLVKEIAGLADLPIELLGQGNFDLVGDVDPSFGKQPNSDYLLDLKTLKIPAGTVATMLGPLNIPTIQFKGVRVKGRLIAGELFIDEGQLGSQGDAISGRFKGKFGLTLQKRGTRIEPRFTNYELKLDLNLTRAAEKDFGIFLSLYDKFKTVTGTGARYAFQLKGSGFRSPPNAESYNRF